MLLSILQDYIQLLLLMIIICLAVKLKILVVGKYILRVGLTQEAHTLLMSSALLALSKK